MNQLTKLCEALGLNEICVKQRIQRGLFVPKAQTVQGKRRIWTIRDVYALVIFEALYAIGADPREANDYAHSISQDLERPPALLLAHVDRSGGLKGAVLFAEQFNFKKWNEDKRLLAATVIDLELLRDRVINAFVD